MPEVHPYTGLKILYYRKLRGLSVRELARLCRLSASSISGYELGKSSPPYDKVIRIAKVLNVAVAILWDFNPPPGAATDPTPRGDLKIVR